MTNRKCESKSKIPTLALRLEQTRGRSTGFDYLRIILALGVIAWHAFPLSYGADFQSNPVAIAFKPLTDAILPMFFALSGFLVAGSLERNRSLVTFVGLRAIRIVPALAVEVLLSALILGPLLTTVALRAYFASPDFRAYFLNILGDIHYVLPGVFLANPFPVTVNGQLWTVPWELRCYLVLTAAALIGIARKRNWLCAGSLVGGIALWVWHMVSHRYSTGTPLLAGFMVGVVLYQYRDKVTWDWRLALLSAFAMFFLLSFAQMNDIAGVPAAYLTVYLGLCNPRKVSFLRGADYSYGLYLYGFAIQQAIARIFPWSHFWYLNLLLSVPTAAVFAAFSWHFIEKPALRLRSFLPQEKSKIAA